MENKFKNPITLHQTCIECGQKFEVTVDMNDLFNFEHGLFVQDAFPYLAPWQRELFFQSNICSSCWDTMFGVEE